jgi:hypothetical protein
VGQGVHVGKLTVAQLINIDVLPPMEAVGSLIQHQIVHYCKNAFLENREYFTEVKLLAVP